MMNMSMTMIKMNIKINKKNMNQMVMLKMNNKLKIKSIILSMDWIKPSLTDDGI